MLNILPKLMRNHKQNIIYISLLLVFNLIISFFIIIKDYNDYYIYEVYGSIIDNRTYILNTENQDIVKYIQNNFELTNLETIPIEENNLSQYYLTFKDYKETQKYKKYIKKAELDSFLADSTKSVELDMIENDANIYNYLLSFLLILSIIILYYMLKNLIFNNLKDIALLKSLGYNQLKVITILTLKIFCIYMFSILLNALLLYLLHFAYLIIDDAMIIKYLQNINILKITLIDFIFVLVSYIINFIFNYKTIKKLSVIHILDEEL